MALIKKGYKKYKKKNQSERERERISFNDPTTQIKAFRKNN